MFMHSQHEKMMPGAVGDQAPHTAGIVLRSPVFYDLTVWLAFFGQEHAFRDKILDLACFVNGESVLNVGCGTGTLAIAAKRRLGASGTVHGVDASPEMLSRAEKKAKKASVEVFFKNSLAEVLPFRDDEFDVVLSNVMFHHLPQKPRRQCANEIRRVLKPGGRVLVVDFEGFSDERRTLLSHFHRPHGHVSARDINRLLSEAGLQTIDSGSVGIRDLQFVLAAAPSR